MIRKRLADERGMSLVEILIAVAVMAVISVSVMGIFTAAAERSADQNRRLIAASLARQKIAELRQMSRMSDVYPPLTNFQVLLAELSANPETAWSADRPLPGPYGGLLDPVVINGTEYRFLAVVDKTVPPEYLNRMASFGGGTSLLRLHLTVYWSGGAAPASAADSVTLEAYVTDAG